MKSYDCDGATKSEKPFSAPAKATQKFPVPDGKPQPKPSAKQVSGVSGHGRIARSGKGK